MTTATDLIAESSRFSEILTADWSPELEADLDRLADDSVCTEDTIEFWGNGDGESMLWRVHLKRPAHDLDFPMVIS